MIKKFTLIIILLFCAFSLSGCSLMVSTPETPKEVINQTKFQTDKISAINQARILFQQKKMSGDDLSKGPCISNDLLPDWVADIAHNPRDPIDDIPQNQCPAFLNGTAHHFVELDLEGNLIKAN